MNKKQKILCVELNKIFDSIKEAAKYFDVDPSGISKVLNGKRKTCGGFTWKRIDDNIKESNNKLSEDEINYWLNKFIVESRQFHSIDELNESLIKLYENLF